MRTLKNILTASLILFIGSQSYSQATDTLNFKRIAITTSLFDYLPFPTSTSTINLGAEVYLKNRKSVGMNLGYITSYGAYDAYEYDVINIKGIKAQVEAKHYLNKRKIFQPAIFVFWPHIFQFKSQDLQNAGYYVAANLSYQTTETKKEETVVDYITGLPYPNFTHYKKNIYTINRDAYAINIKFGYNCIKKRGFNIDYAVGLGAQLIETLSKNRITPQYFPSDNNFWGSHLYEHDGGGIYPTVIYQLKLGYAF